MTKHEKHAHAANRQGDQPKAQDAAAEYESLDELAGSTGLLKTSLAAGNEMKIAVGVIAVLLVIFAAAMVKWMRHSSAPSPSDETAQVENDKKPAAGDKDGKDTPERSPFGPGNRASERTVLTATSGSGGEFRPKSRAGDRDGWPSASEDKSKPASTPDDRQSLPSFQSRPKLGDLSSRAGDATERGAGRPSRGNWASDKANDAGGGGQGTNASTSDPFRSRPAVDGLRRDHSAAAGIPSAPAGSATSDALRGSPRSGDATASSRTPIGSNPLRFPDAGSAAPAAPGRMANTDAVGLATPGVATDRRSDGMYAADARTRATGVSATSNVSGARNAYVVQPGDNIYEIARQELGKASRWREIYDLNRDVLGTRSLELTPGTRLLLPDAGPTAVSRRNDAGQRR